MSNAETSGIVSDTSPSAGTHQTVAPSDLRHFAGQFPTGVAVVTGRDDAGKLHGLTLNAVTSLSLDPPLYLVCLGAKSSTLKAIIESGAFGINFLAEHQESASRIFATKDDDKFSSICFKQGHLDIPLIDDAVATAVCRVETIYPGGDHRIVVGRVEAYSVTGGNPLMYLRGKYLGESEVLAKVKDI